MEDPYGWRLAEIYDLFYAAESAESAELIRARRPDARSLLDVAVHAGELHAAAVRGPV